MATNLTNRARLEFKNPICDSIKFKEVMSKLSRDEQVSIRWSVIINHLEDPRKGVESEERLQRASGTIYSTNKDQGFISLPFSVLTQEVEGSPAYVALEFDQVPGYEEGDYPNKDPMHWDHFRTYFEKNYPWAK